MVNFPFKKKPSSRSWWTSTRQHLLNIDDDIASFSSNITYFLLFTVNQDHSKQNTPSYAQLKPIDLPSNEPDPLNDLRPATSDFSTNDSNANQWVSMVYLLSEIRSLFTVTLSSHTCKIYIIPSCLITHFASRAYLNVCIHWMIQCLNDVFNNFFVLFILTMNICLLVEAMWSEDE